jgi:hypothetical protein
VTSWCSSWHWYLTPKWISTLRHYTLIELFFVVLLSLCQQMFICTVSRSHLPQCHYCYSIMPLVSYNIKFKMPDYADFCILPPHKTVQVYNKLQCSLKTVHVITVSNRKKLNVFILSKSPLKHMKRLSWSIFCSNRKLYMSLLLHRK